MNSMKNYYDILQVNPKASPEIIEKAYHFLAKKYHPDMQSDEIEKLRCEQILKDLNEAYYVLSDVFLREQYDKELQNQNIQNKQNINTTNCRWAISTEFPASWTQASAMTPTLWL